MLELIPVAPPPVTCFPPLSPLATSTVPSGSPAPLPAFFAPRRKAPRNSTSSSSSLLVSRAIPPPTQPLICPKCNDFTTPSAEAARAAARRRVRAGDTCVGDADGFLGDPNCTTRYRRRRSPPNTLSVLCRPQLPLAFAWTFLAPLRLCLAFCGRYFQPLACGRRIGNAHALLAARTVLITLNAGSIHARPRIKMCRATEIPCT